jgi:tricorn protease
MDGYYRYPTVHDDAVVFVSEDDLWEVPLEGGRVRRLTSVKGEASHPSFSPDGSKIAFTATEEGTPEVFVMKADGSPPEQLTFNGTQSSVVGWMPDGERIVFRSNYREVFPKRTVLYTVPAEGGEVERLPLGQAQWISHESDGEGRVLGRHTDDLARWKRYRGGRAGTIWLDPEGDGDWEQLFDDQDAGLVRPLWVGDRIYLTTDAEGYGNLYSCRPDGSDLERHTDYTGFYTRFARTDGSTIVYTRGGDLHRFDVDAAESHPIDVDYGSSRTQLSRKFVDAQRYLDDYALHPAGHSMAVTTRGKLFNFGLWEGAVRQNGRERGVRYRLPRYLDDERLLTISDEPGDRECFEIHPTSGEEAPERLELDGDGDVFEEVGRPIELELSPNGEEAVFSNHRQELIHLNLETEEVSVLDHSPHRRISGLDWSPDGEYVAYGYYNSWSTSEIRLVEVENGETRAVTTGEYRDVAPVFDPQGRYLYFLSCRMFNPVYDQVFFELSFPHTMKPCVVTLREDEPSPFFEEPRPLEGTGGGPKEGAEVDEEDEAEDVEADGEADADNGESEDDEEEDEPEPLDIDFEGIERRIETFPVEEAEYVGLEATENHVFWTVHSVEGSLGSDWSDTDDDHGTLQRFSLDGGDASPFAHNVSSFRLGPDGRTMIYESGGRLRVVNATARKGPAQRQDGGQEPSRETGWIDLGRIRVSVDPRREWEQMLREAWRLMRDHFWRENMSGVEWEHIWDRYSERLERVSTRHEFSDLIWTMHGELGTSHAYEMGGDYPDKPRYHPGFLGADVTWDEEVEWEWNGDEGSGGYRLEHVVRGETWEQGASSPLDRPGLDVEEGDVVVAVNGRELDGGASLQKSLVHRAGEAVEVSIADAEGEVETHTVELLRSEFSARYREWVRQNRERVHEASDGELGYVHIPDMGPRGFSEFHRSFLAERDRTGLVVDVRYNGGGHVSQLILEKLAREQIGYDLQRWGQPKPYPSGAMRGPLVGLTNEYAGSDGDIFSHAFKLMGLGPLMGKRTWGGIIGIWPRHQLVDGSIVTQPEFASWFEDVGFGLENYGTEPDIVVDDPPGTMEGDADPQLDAAIDKALELLEIQQPEQPDFGPYPDRSPPETLD